jgi:hypothetical protein
MLRLKEFISRHRLGSSTPTLLEQLVDTLEPDRRIAVGNLPGTQTSGLSILEYRANRLSRSGVDSHDLFGSMFQHAPCRRIIQAKIFDRIAPNKITDKGMHGAQHGGVPALDQRQ